jgi:hypothetical protein
MPIDDKRHGTTANTSSDVTSSVTSAPAAEPKHKHHNPISKLWNSMGRPVEEPGVYKNSHFDEQMKAKDDVGSGKRI